MKRVKIKHLTEYIGYPIGVDVFIERNKEAMAGEPVSRDLINKLKNNDFSQDFIYVDTPDSQGIRIADLISEEIKQQINTQMDRIFLGYCNIKKEADEIKRIVSIIMEAVYKDPLIVFNLDSMLVVGDKSLASHCLNTSIISTTLAIKAGLPKKVVEDVAIGAALHDIGKLNIDSNLNDVTYKYNKKDYIKMFSHTVEGFKLLSNPKFNTNIRKIVLMHHVWEKYEASYNDDLGIYESYPNTFDNTEISPKVKDLAVSIVQAADAFEAMVNKVQEYAQKKSRLEAIEYIRSMEKTRFGKGAKLLVSNISPFTIGSEVVLNDDSQGIVIEHNNCPDRPYIKLLTGERAGMVINLVSLEGRKLYIDREI